MISIEQGFFNHFFVFLVEIYLVVALILEEKKEVK